MYINHTVRHSTSFLFIVCLLLSLLPSIAEARTVVRSGDTVSIGQDQKIEGDFYTAGNIINMSGYISNDLLAAGTNVNINGQVEEDVLIVGGDVNVNGTVGDDLRVIGGTVIIAEPVLGDVFIIGANVKLLSTASVTGDVTVIGGTFEIESVVEGRVLGWVETLRIDSEVQGGVDVTVGALTLGDRAVVRGDVKYVSENTLTRSQSATVEGEELRNDPVTPVASDAVTGSLIPLLILLFSVAVWYLLSRQSLQRVVQRALTPGVRPVLIGVLTILLAPFAISVLLVSMLGMLVGLAVMLIYMLFLVLAMVAMPVVFGEFVLSLVNKTTSDLSLLSLVVGVVLVGLCALVPIIGPILIVGFTVITFGVLVDILISSHR